VLVTATGVQSLRQDSNPHLGRTKGACLPLTLRRLRWRRRESNPRLPWCKQGDLPQASPDADRYTTATTNWQSRCGGDDRARTGDLSVDNRLLFSSELRPRISSAGGIRTHGLELMRLARTASPLPRRSARLDSNQRSPVPKTGGVAKLPYRQMSFVDTPGGSRTCTVPIKSRQLSAELRSRERCGRQESNLRRAAFQTAALH
jgi:hypothetical protein